MDRYESLIQKLRKHNLLEHIESITNEELMRELECNPNLPCDYIDFLQEIGHGDIYLEDPISIFSGLVDPRSTNTGLSPHPFAKQAKLSGVVSAERYKTDRVHDICLWYVI